ncbi:MAG: copper resistance protein CopC [Candidatus Planktophila sp.]|nr:copper resistance protein CopC [Candidatus Planktophila sp.]
MSKKSAILLAILALLFMPLSSAFAHGEVTKASPSQDGKVLAMPSEVSIDFDGQLQSLGDSDINLITVTDATGRVISDASSLVEGSKISTKILLTDSTGLISVHYRIVSGDAHPVEGDYSFTVGETPIAMSATGEESEKVAESSQEDSKSPSLPVILGIVILVVSGFAILRRLVKK